MLIVCRFAYAIRQADEELSFPPVLQRAYEFKPVPENFPVHLVPQILGASCQMWGEWQKISGDMDRLMKRRQKGSTVPLTEISE